MAETAKAAGNAAFKAQDYEAASRHYSAALDALPGELGSEGALLRAMLLCNRCQARQRRQCLPLRIRRHWHELLQTLRKLYPVTPMDRRGLRPIRQRFDEKQRQGTMVANDYPMLHGEGFFEKGMAQWHAKRAGNSVKGTYQRIDVKANAYVPESKEICESATSKYECNASWLASMPGGESSMPQLSLFEQAGKSAQETCSNYCTPSIPMPIPKAVARGGKEPQANGRNCNTGGKLHNQHSTGEHAIPHAPEVVKKCSKEVKETRPGHDLSAGVGASVFWSFVTKSLLQSSSAEALYEELKAIQHSNGTAHQHQVNENAYAGAQLILGKTSCQDHRGAVKIVAATQRWALKHVPGFQEVSQVLCLTEELHKQARKPPLSQASVALMLSRFKQHQHAKKALVSSTCKVPARRTHCNVKSVAPLKPRRIKGKSAAPQWLSDEGKKCEDGTKGMGKAPVSTTASGEHHSRGNTDKERLQSCKSQIAATSNLCAKPAYAAAKKPGASLEAAKPKKRQRPDLPRTQAHHSKRLKVTGQQEENHQSSTATNSKLDKSNDDKQVLTDNGIKKGNPKEKAKVFDVSTGTYPKRKAEETCGICNQAHSSAPRSCSTCTLQLMQKNDMDLQIGQYVWCSGFGPAWPSRIEAISFRFPEDTKPYLVRFYGDGRCAWVGKKQVRDWSARRPHDPKVLQPRWRARMAKAIAEVEAALVAEAEACVQPSADLP